MSLFDHLVLGNSALDRFVNANYEIIINGTNCRERLSPPKG